MAGFCSGDRLASARKHPREVDSGGGTGGFRFGEGAIVSYRLEGGMTARSTPHLMENLPRMTLAIAWVRNVSHTTELIIAADSRLRSIGHWDGCPKMFALGRSDAAFCFAGNTMHAYPMMLQAKSAVEMFPKARTRGLDLCDLKGHIVRVMNGMRAGSQMQLADSEWAPDTAFLLGGFSWKFSDFRLWTIYYDPRIKRFTYRPASRWRKSGSKRIHFVGDDLFLDPLARARIQILRLCYQRTGRVEPVYFHVIEEARARLERLLRHRGKIARGGFDMEPFEVLRDMIRSGHWPTLGGPPQILKVYRHMNCQPFGVYWPNRAAKAVAVLGRVLLEDEAPDCPVLDPDTLKVDRGPWRKSSG